MLKSDIIAALPKLSRKEMAEVGVALKLLSALDGGPGPATTVISDDWLLSGIATYLARRALLPEKNAMFELKRRDAYKQYLSKLPVLMGFLVKLQADSNLSKRHQLTLGFLCARSLGDMLQARNYFSVGAMLSQIDKIPEALDQAYPGYMQSNWFGFVLSADGTLL